MNLRFGLALAAWALIADIHAQSAPSRSQDVRLSPADQTRLSELKAELRRTHKDPLLEGVVNRLESLDVLEQIRSTARSPKGFLGLSVPILGSRPDAEKAKDRGFLYVLSMGAVPERVLKRADTRFTYEYLEKAARSAQLPSDDLAKLKSTINRDLVLARYEARPRGRGFSPYGMDPDTPASEGGRDLAPGLRPKDGPAGDWYDYSQQRFGRLVWRTGFSEVALIGRPAAQNPAVHCSGALLNNLWVLTAAHCFFDDSNQRISRKEMSVYLRNQGGRASVRGLQQNALNTEMLQIGIADVEFFDKAFVPDAKYVLAGADIALIRLEAAPPRAVHLPTIPLSKAETPVTIGGYGLTNAHVVGLAGSTLEISRKEMPDIREKTIVLDKRSESSLGGVCKGDSGGPVFIGSPDGTEVLRKVRHQIVGVVSAAFTRLSGLHGCYGVEMYASRVDRPEVRKWICDTLGRCP